MVDPWEDCCNDFYLFGFCENTGRKNQGIVLVLGAVAPGEPNLGKRVLESRLFCCLREQDVIVEIPLGPLRNPAYNQAATDVGDPIGKLHRSCRVGAHVCPLYPGSLRASSSNDVGRLWRRRMEFPP